MKFDGQYVDDTLLVVKPQDLSAIHVLLNGFDKNLQFNNGLFENEVPHFLELEISPDGISIYWNNTNTGLYVKFTSFVTWSHHTTWISSLVTPVLKICSRNKLSQELRLIKKFPSWNDFLKHIVNITFYKTLQAHQDKNESNFTEKQKRTYHNLLPFSKLWR